MMKFCLICLFFLYGASVSLAQQMGQRLTFELLDTAFSVPHSIQEVAKLGTHFIPVQKDFLNLGFNTKAAWLRVRVPPSMEEKPLFLELEYPLLDSVTLFFREKTPLDSPPRWLSKTSGDAVSFYQRDVIYHTIIFKVNPAFVEESMFYFRIKTDGSLQVSLRLWNEQTLQKEMQDEQFVFGALFGVFAVLAAYGLVIGSMLAARIYLYYGILVLAVAFFVAVFDGYAFQYLWASAPIWGNEALPFGIGVLTVSAVNFTQAFLGLKKHAPLLHRLMQVCAFVGGLIASLVFIGHYNLLTQVAVINGGAAAVLIFFGSVITRARSVKFARFMVSGSYFFLIGILLTALKSFAVIDITFVTKHAVELGSVFYLLSAAVAVNEKYSVWKTEELDESV